MHESINALDNKYTKGNGTQTSPFIIKNPRQLDNLRNDSTVYYALGSDICFENSCDVFFAPFYNEGKGWAPIGSEYDGKPFSGSLEGADYGIKDLHIVASISDGDNVGLFGATNDATLTNIVVDGNIEIDVAGCEKVNVGSLVGLAEGGAISNCVNNATIAAKVSNYIADSANACQVGGLIGEASDVEMLSGCSNSDQAEINLDFGVEPSAASVDKS